VAHPRSTLDVGPSDWSGVVTSTGWTWSWTAWSARAMRPASPLRRRARP